MQALQLAALDGPDALALVEIPEPVAAEGMVLIDVHAAGAGFVDVLMTRGEYQIRAEPPYVPGVEAMAGIVRVAPAGSSLQPGDGVGVGPRRRLRRGGPCAGAADLRDPGRHELRAGRRAGRRLPDRADLGLVRRGRTQPGETVLVHGASGGVGTAAIQVARALGARAIAVATGEAKPRSPGLPSRRGARRRGYGVTGVRELTGGRGADVVVDPVGGDRFDQSLRCMAPEGRLLVVGFAAGRIPS